MLNIVTQAYSLAAFLATDSSLITDNREVSIHCRAFTINYMSIWFIWVFKKGQTNQNGLNRT